MAATKQTSQTDLYSKYAPVNPKQIKKLVEDENKNLKQGFAGSLELVPGKQPNKIRLFPKHPEDPNFMVQKGTHWLTIEVDGEPKRRTAPDAKIHGGLSQDPCDAYLEFVRNKLDSTDPESKAKLKEIASREKYIGCKTSWLGYASFVILKDGKSTVGKPDVWDIKKSVRDDINSGMIIEDDDEAIEVDPYTHPQTGRYLLVTYNDKAKVAKDYYKTQVSEKSVAIPLDVMEIFDKMTPLSKLSDVNYSAEDFERELEGIRYIDEAEDINLFDSEEFQEIVAGLRAELDGEGGAEIKAESEDDAPFEETKPKAKVAAPVKGKVAVKVVEPEEEAEAEAEAERESEEDQFSQMDRNELVTYKNENEYPIKLLKSDTDEEMRIKIREHEATLVVEEEPEAEAEAEVAAPPVKTKAAPAKSGGKITLDSIKESLKNKNGNKK